MLFPRSPASYNDILYDALARRAIVLHFKYTHMQPVLRLRTHTLCACGVCVRVLSLLNYIPFDFHRLSKVDIFNWNFVHIILRINLFGFIISD